MNSQLKEIRNKEFGDFIKWLELNGLKDCFSSSCWEIALFNDLHSKQQKEDGSVLNKIPTNIIEGYLKMRKEEEAKKNGGKVAMPDKTLVNPQGAKL